MNKPQRMIDRLVRMGEDIVDEKVRLARRFESAAAKAREYDFSQHAYREVNLEDMRVYQAKFDGGMEMFRETCFELGIEVETIQEYLQEVEDRIKAYFDKKLA